VTEAGGKAIAVRCGYSDDEQAGAMIERVIAEQGRSDIIDILIIKGPA